MKINRRNFLGMAGTGAVALGLETAVANVFPFESNHHNIKDMDTIEQNSNKVVILLAHPTFDKSVANKALIEAVKGLSGVKVIDIYAEPFKVGTYLQAITEAATVVFQFPFYWLSAPSQLKKWCDEIFGAFMETIKDKKLQVSVTTGSEYEAYRSGGRNQFTIDELLRPYQALAHHSGMVWQTPFAVYGTGLPTAPDSIKVGAIAYKELIQSCTK
jgi:glutathione-regulated potassium-efflux system ancillary protein KefG